MQEAGSPGIFALQNHLPVAEHLTTEAGLWMLQYVHAQYGSSVGALESASPHSTKSSGAAPPSDTPASG